ncbi:MAG: M28 family metallopeptidase [Terriglobia bacterium]
MRRFIITLILCLTCFLLSAVAAEEPAQDTQGHTEAVWTPRSYSVQTEAGGITGYSDESARSEREWEAKFQALPSNHNMRDYDQHLSARPHHVGSPYDKENADWILSQFKAWGLDAHIETFQVLFPTPKERALELVGPTKFTAKLEEPTLAVDPTSGQKDEQLPTYNAYSADGDVTAPLVYVNFGAPADYEKLDRLGISVKGAIVIARYGQTWRGIKPKVAAEHGALGCLIYSDPHEDGYFQGDVFPEGAFRPRDGVQRGSVVDMTLYSGDPLTPGVGATADAKRLPLDKVEVLTKIPTLPISYGDAQPLLAALTGPVAPAEWRGALPVTYHIGPGPAKVHLKLKFNWPLKPINDVIAKIPGSVFPDEWIIRGNHHDAWVNGAEDPLSGQVALLEEAHALGELVQQGWKPRRTIIYCAWDGEEPGLLGSTEWAETHADELRRNAAVYINSDSNSRGYLSAGGSHTLQKFINGVARSVDDPEKHISVWQRSEFESVVRAPNAEARNKIRQRKDLSIGALGSGSDYTPFLQHLGIASLDLGYGGEDGGGIYHSIYDDFYWYTHFDDPEFIYGRTLAQTAGTAVMRLADAELLPFDFTEFADTLHEYLDELQKLAGDKRDGIIEQNKEIEDGALTATADPTKPFVPPAVEPVPPFLNFAPLENGVAEISRSAEHYQRALEKAQQNGGAVLAHASLDRLNQALMESERKLTSPEGLPRRPWYVHQIYAPGFYTGYGVKTIPLVREAIEQKQWGEADRGMGLVGNILVGEAALIESAASELDQLSH